MTNTALKDITTIGTIGTLTYNDLVFSPMRHIEFQSEPVYDDADRTVVYVKHTIVVTALVSNTSEGDQATAMLDLRGKLMEPGKELLMTGLGFGDTIINGTVTGAILDVAWGPKPRSVKLTPVGGLLTWEVIWECDFHIPECDGTTATTGMMAMNYTTSYIVDGLGLTTRQIKGYYQIPQTRKQTGSERVVALSPESQWDKIVVRIPDGFRRIQNQREISMDKTRMDFSITDQELVGPPFPPGIVDAKLRFRMESKDIGFAAWTATFAGTYTVAKGNPTCRAAEAFYGDAFNQLRRLYQGYVGQGGVVIPSGITFEESPYDRTSSFSMRFNVTGTVRDHLSSSGFWRPLASTDYRRWRSSMNQIFARRGFAGLFYNPAEDAIIDLCQSNSTVVIGLEKSDALRQPQDRCRGLFDCDNINEKNSWLRYENKVHTICQQDYVLHKPIGTGSRKPRIIQLVAAADEFVVMTGKALRIKFKPEIPKLKTVQKTRVFEVENESAPAELVADIFGCAVYQATWRIVYVPEETLSVPAPQPPDPILEE